MRTRLQLLFVLVSVAAAFLHRGPLLAPQTALCAADATELEAALASLAQFDEAYLARMRHGRTHGKTPQQVEFERAQLLKADGLKAEREELRFATKLVASAAVETTLGIKAESGTRGLEVLKAWVSGLSLTRGVLRAVDENNAEVPIDRWNEFPVYIKYNSTEGGDAYMKPYEGGFGGVIFQPFLSDQVFRQYGDLPLNTHTA